MKSVPLFASTSGFVLACAWLVTGACADLTPDAARGSLPSVVVPAADTNLLYIGRWDMTNADQPHSHWGAAYVRTKFTGTTISIRLGSAGPLVVSIDHEAFRAVQGGKGDTALNEKPLAVGTHDLIVGPSEGNEPLFRGLVLDEGAMTKPTTQRPIIEFIGDSITWGTGPENLWTVNWNWNTAEALDCDHVQVAQPARALTTGYGCADEHTGMDKQYFMMKNFGYVHDNPQVPWTFSYTPAVIVINLGQNDACGNEPDSVFLSSYVNFVKNIRAKFPLAQIAALRMFGGDHFGRDTKQAVDALNAAGDDRVHFIDTEGWLDKDDFVDGVHPNGHGNLKIIARLAPELRPLLQSGN